MEGTDHVAQVHFTSEHCTFEWSGAHSINKNQETITINGQNIYIAKTWVKLPADPVPDGSYSPYLIKASQEEEAPNNIEILVYSINDGEKSHNIGIYTHQKYNLEEIPGDNYVSVLDTAGNIVIDPGSASDYKDIMIELDWYKWADDVDITDIKEIANLIKEILYTAGIDTLGSIIIGNEIEMSENLTRQERMTLLAEHKQSLIDEERIWLNRIHMILGSNNPGDTIGINEMYPVPGEIFNVWHTMHLGSGGLSFASPYLDSVGCFVFAKKIVNYPGLLITVNQAIALAAAHEIGHALGMWHYDNIPGVGYIKNVMNSNIQVAFTTLNGFALYGFFNKRTLDGSYDTDNYTNDGMNTRHVLGLECVNSIHE